MRAETRPHEAGFGSNRVSEARGEYVPAPCTHRPSKHPSGVRMRPSCDGRIWAPQGGLSRNKVAVEESAAGSPPTDRDQASGLTHLHSVVGYNNRMVLTGDHKSPRVGKRRLLHGPAGLTRPIRGGYPLTGMSGATPDGSVLRIAFESVPLSVGRRSDVVRRQMHHPG